MLDQVSNANEEHCPNVDRQSPKEQQSREHPTCQTECKETVDASRKDQVISQQAAAILVLGNVPDIPAHRMIGPDDQVPEWIERGAILLPRTHGVQYWDLHKAMVLQMDRLKGVEVYKIEWTE